jgi:DNA-binding MarR family transcriptional regulator
LLNFEIWNSMSNSSPLPRELQILEQIENNPDTTQATLAEQLGVAVGTVNFAVKRLIKKGYIRVKQLERRRLKYIITPAGIALRTKLAMDSLQYSMRLYRETRERAKQLITQAKRQGATALVIDGNGELADVVRLTCLEMGIPVQTGSGLAIVIVGTTLKLETMGSAHA